VGISMPHETRTAWAASKKIARLLCLQVFADEEGSESEVPSIKTLGKIQIWSNMCRMLKRITQVWKPKYAACTVTTIFSPRGTPNDMLWLHYIFRMQTIYALIRTG
jgi:hypothetical protein